MIHFETKALKKAKELGESSTPKDEEKIDENLNSMNKGVIAKIWDKVIFLWDRFKSPETPLSLKVTIIGVLLYLILPVDVIPDAIPGLGLIDDAAVILFVFKEVSKFMAPKLIKHVQTKILESCYQKIDIKLKQVFNSTLISCSIVVVINFFAFLISKMNWFSPATHYVSLGLILAGCLFSLIRAFIYLKQYGKISLDIFKSVLKNKRVKKGIAEYVRSEYVYINYLFAGIDIANDFFPELQIPDLEEIVSVFIKNYIKRIILFCLFLVSYGVLITALRLI